MTDIQKVKEALAALCNRIDQIFVDDVEDAEEGDWYLEFYTTEEYSTFALYECGGLNREEDEANGKISSDLTLEEWLLALQVSGMFVTQYNINMQ